MKQNENCYGRLSAFLISCDTPFVAFHMFIQRAGTENVRDHRLSARFSKLRNIN